MFTLLLSLLSLTLSVVIKKVSLLGMHLLAGLCHPKEEVSLEGDNQERSPLAQASWGRVHAIGSWSLKGGCWGPWTMPFQELPRAMAASSTTNHQAQKHRCLLQMHSLYPL